MSSGILMFRIINNEPYFLLVHPGGPYFKNKDIGAWTIPKGKIEKDETIFNAALREFYEETGYELNEKDKYIHLGYIKQKGGKVVHAWAWQDYKYDDIIFSSTTFEMSNKKNPEIMNIYPEIDKWEFFNFEQSKIKINPAQISFLEQINTIFNTKNKLNIYNPIINCLYKNKNNNNNLEIKSF